MINGITMNPKFTLQYWLDDGWYVGKLKEIHGVFSQGETLNELIANIKEVYKLMVEDDSIDINYPKTEIPIEVLA